MEYIQIPGKDFEMTETLVTQKEWELVMGNNPSYFKGENKPVESISWHDCQEFLKKLNGKNDGYVYRLPTEEEWEFCAQSCDNQKIMEIAWVWENSEKTTHPVRQKKPNEYGLYDMLGNVWEWTDAKDGSYHVIRGGSCYCGARVCRSDYCIDYGPSYRSSITGFRLVRTKALSFNTLDEFAFSSTAITLDKSDAAKRVEAIKEIRRIRRKLTKLEELLK